MSDHVVNHTLTQADHDKRRVALASLLAAVLLTGTKLGVGLWTGSLGILSEAAHSALDLVAAAMTLWAVRVSSRPADTEHHYGHGKIENLSALFETLLLLVTCVWIIKEASQRLFLHKVFELDINAWAFAVVILSIVVDYSRSRALKHAAEKYSSQALEADALHFSTDIWSSAVVLLGLLCVWIGRQLHIEWLDRADAAAALGVAGIVIWVSLKLGKKSVDDLLDSVPLGLQDTVTAAARQVAGVVDVNRVRMRRSGPEIFSDVTITVERVAALERAHDITQQVEEAVRAAVPNSDVVVHVEPIAPAVEDVTTVVRLLAARHGLGAHAVRIYEEEGQRWLELHLEVAESLLLEEAHRQASEFERELRQNIPGVTRIVTHLEPVGEGAAILRSQRTGTAEIQKVIKAFLDNYPTPVNAHDIRVQMVNDELAISFHCGLDASTAITEAHDLTVRLEEYLRANVPGVARVAIHVEPDKPSQAKG